MQIRLPEPRAPYTNNRAMAPGSANHIFALNTQYRLMEQERRSKGMIEAELTSAFTQFEREHLGRGPKEARSYIVHDMIVVRLKGILTPAEQNLATEPDGTESIKRIRTRLIESSTELIRAIVESCTGAVMVSLHTDISVRTAERVFVIVLDRDLEEHPRGQ